MYVEHASICGLDVLPPGFACSKACVSFRRFFEIVWNMPKPWLLDRLVTMNCVFSARKKIYSSSKHCSLI